MRLVIPWLPWMALLAVLGGPATGSPPAPAVSRAEVVDGETQHPRRAIHDVERAWVEIAGGVMTCGVRMRKPVLEGTQLSVHFTFDADDDPTTGYEGCELWVTGACGSHFRRMNDTGEATGLPAATSFIRAVYARVEVEEQENRDGTVRRRWSWGVPQPLPALRLVGDKELHIGLPAQLLVDAGLRYNAKVGWHANVVGRICDRPISLLVRIQDEGTDIQVDGNPTDWSVTPRVDDVVGETHPDVAELDLASLAVDHGPDRLFLLLGMARAGFRTETSDDVVLTDKVTVAVDPADRDLAYMAYTEHVVQTQGAPEATEVAMRGPWLELALPRRPEQTSLRVLAWSQAQRSDRAPDRGQASLVILPGSLK